MDPRHDAWVEVWEIPQFLRPNIAEQSGAGLGRRLEPPLSLMPESTIRWSDEDPHPARSRCRGLSRMRHANEEDGIGLSARKDAVVTEEIIRPSLLSETGTLPGFRWRSRASGSRSPVLDFARWS